ncbi:MAG: type II toxin-antitoxin system RelB/DinJ family antitoxin [Spirochaetales bacterium]|nr:type II toxin-antitoxin system RelB/DinJ family antitoxin [Spirochaetales bacterium]MBQ3922000.1 type II toxin-antitoxin system RelB/DinJ family antitoxin [Spirochaetales bacterium]MBR6060480.1 type II toxin-antitoxin system RelB/DinJ family antitoxin [Spirochaetales bacterium]
MTTLQIRVDETLKHRSDTLFSSLGMDTSTAVRIFLNSAVEYNGIPFSIRHIQSDDSLETAISDTRNKTHLNGPFNSANSAVLSMLED